MAEHHAQPSHKHAHHLKYGHIETSGHLEDDASDDELEEEQISAEALPAGHALRHASTTSSLVSASTGKTRARPLDPKSKRLRKLEQEEARRRLLHQERRYFFRRPRALQYFRGNVLVRSEEERSSQRLELFFDLVFAGLIATLAKEAVDDHDAAALVRYLITYAGALMIWNYMREIFNSFFVDDMPQRLLVLIIMACLVVYGNNAPFVERALNASGARETTIGSYLVAGFILNTTTFFYSFFVCQYRMQIRSQCLTWIIASGLWIGAIFVSVRAAIAMTVVALAIEYFAWCYFFSPHFKRLMKLRYSSAVAIEHEIDRLSDFVTLIHGEFLFSVISGQPAGTGIHLGVLRAVFTVIIAFSFHGMYCIGAGSKSITHPIRHSASGAFAWFTLHLPIISAVTLCGDSTARLISDTDVPQGIRWIFSGTYATAMVTMTALTLIEKDHDKPGELWLRRPVRLAPRFVAALVVLLLPLADSEKLDSTATLAIAASLALASWIFGEIGALDGPNAAWYTLKSTDNHNVESAVGAENFAASSGDFGDTHVWRGIPKFVEPGTWAMDKRNQQGRAATFASDSTKDPAEPQNTETVPSTNPIDES